MCFTLGIPLKTIDSSVYRNLQSTSCSNELVSLNWSRIYNEISLITITSAYKVLIRIILTRITIDGSVYRTQLSTICCNLLVSLTWWRVYNQLYVITISSTYKLSIGTISTRIILHYRLRASFYYQIYQVCIIN